MANDSTSPAPTVVLVHGAWHGAWCWDPIVQRLEAAGVSVVAIDLPGHGADPGPLTDLHGDADRVSDVLDGVRAPVVLVGHSYGGAVITDVGLHPAVAQLVYVTAFPLAEGETLGAAAPEEALAAGVADEMQALGAAIVMGDDGNSTLPADAARALLYNTTPAETTDWAVAQLGPQPIATMLQPARAIAWRDRPSTYIVCERDLGVPPAFQRILAARCEMMLTLDCDHSPFASEPDALTEQLISIVARAATS